VVLERLRPCFAKVSLYTPVVLVRLRPCFAMVSLHPSRARKTSPLLCYNKHTPLLCYSKPTPLWCSYDYAPLLCYSKPAYTPESCIRAIIGDVGKGSLCRAFAKNVQFTVNMPAEKIGSVLSKILLHTKNNTFSECQSDLYLI
jgi:hypothetical protein